MLVTCMAFPSSAWMRDELWEEAHLMRSTPEVGKEHDLERL